MTNRNKRNGDKYERDVAHYLAALGFGAARMLRTGAHDDLGDIIGVDGALIDCKRRADVAHLSGWLDEACREAAASELLPLVVIRRVRRNVGDSYCVQTLSHWAADRRRNQLLTAALRARIDELERHLNEVLRHDRHED